MGCKRNPRHLCVGSAYSVCSVNNFKRESTPGGLSKSATPAAAVNAACHLSVGSGTMKRRMLLVLPLLLLLLLLSCAACAAATVACFEMGEQMRQLDITA